MVDCRSDAIRFTLKNIAFRRFGGTDDRRYRRGLWPAGSRPPIVLTKHFVTEANANSVCHFSSDLSSAIVGGYRFLLIYFGSGAAGVEHEMHSFQTSPSRTNTSKR